MKINRNLEPIRNNFFVVPLEGSELSNLFELSNTFYLATVEHLVILRWEMKYSESVFRSKLNCIQNICYVWNNSLVK